jgi:hypothetical protein
MDLSLRQTSQSGHRLRGGSRVSREVHHAARQLRSRTYQIWNTLLGRHYVHMLHIGKTGGTAIKAAIRQVPTRPDLSLRLHRHNAKFVDVPDGDKVFFFVRDPLTRFVSGFYSRQRQGRPHYLSPWSPAEATAFARFETPNALGNALALSDPPIRAAAVAAMRGIRHVKSSYWDWFHDTAYFENRLSDVLFIGFQETLDGDFERLKALLNLPAHVELPKDEARSHRSPAGLDRTLDDTSQAALREWYARDYEFVELCRSLRSRWLRRDCA